MSIDFMEKDWEHMQVVLGKSRRIKLPLESHLPSLQFTREVEDELKISLQDGSESWIVRKLRNEPPCWAYQIKKGDSPYKIYFDKTSMESILERHKSCEQENHLFEECLEVKKAQNWGFKQCLEKQYDDEDECLKVLAMEMVLKANNRIISIDGAPGTGKSKFLSQLLMHLIDEEKQVLVLTTNQSTLNVLIKMVWKELGDKQIEVDPDAVMCEEKLLGHLDKYEEIKSAVNKLRYENICESHDFYECHEFYENLGIETTDIISAFNEEVATEIEDLMNNVLVYFSLIDSPFLDMAAVNKNFSPEMVLIDDASQVLLSHKIPSILRLKKFVLAGDPYLFPRKTYFNYSNHQDTVMKKIEREKEYYPRISFSTQYRSNEAIVKWSSEQFYDRKLNTYKEDGVEKEKHWIGNNVLSKPFVMIDTSLLQDEEASKAFETFHKHKHSRRDMYSNETEAILAVEILYQLFVDNLMNADKMAIITTEKYQIAIIKEKMKSVVDNMKVKQLFWPRIFLASDIQGQEFDAVVFSPVRNNPKKDLGYIADDRRLHHIITRARRFFVYVGSSHMLENKNKNIENLLRTFVETSSRHHPDCINSGRVDDTGDESTPVSHNFGQDYGNFIEHLNSASHSDERMLNWCNKDIERRKNKQKYEEAKKRAEQEKMKRRQEMEYRRNCMQFKPVETIHPIPYFRVVQQHPHTHSTFQIAQFVPFPQSSIRPSQFSSSSDQQPFEISHWNQPFGVSHWNRPFEVSHWDSNLAARSSNDHYQRRNPEEMSFQTSYSNWNQRENSGMCDSGTSHSVWNVPEDHIEIFPGNENPAEDTEVPNNSPGIVDSLTEKSSTEEEIEKSEIVQSVLSSPVDATSLRSELLKISESSHSGNDSSLDDFQTTVNPSEQP